MVQKYSPEKNLYNRLNYLERFDDKSLVTLSLPFWGEWKVTQGYEGQYTHKGEWKHALDFEIVDERGLTFEGSGSSLSDYYCYDKPVIAPGDGWIENVMDGVEDNPIDQLNLEQNWGNTIIIKHSDDLYSKISHLKKGSFKVKKGDQIKKGDLLAHCGNSGRSPKPHLHFQVQKDPFIGSKTREYPFGYFMERNENQHQLKTYDIPQQEYHVSNISLNDSLKNAFHFVPGQRIKFSVKDMIGKADLVEEWDVRTDIYNNSFIFCTRTRSRAYFKQEDGIHYFTFFEGSRKSLLYYFYLAAYKVIYGYYKDLKIRDTYPLNVIPAKWLGVIQDFCAPFFKMINSVYSMEYYSVDDSIENSRIQLKSSANLLVKKRVKKRMNFDLYIEGNGIKYFKVKTRNKAFEATWLK